MEEKKDEQEDANQAIHDGTNQAASNRVDQAEQARLNKVHIT